MAQVIALLCPRRIVIGGGVSMMGEQVLFEPLRELVAAQVFQPFAGIYELGFMPLMNIVGGLLAYGVARAFKRNYLVAGLVYAAVIGLSVSWMLHVLFNLPLEALVPLLIASEEAVMIIGAVLFYLVDRRWKWYQ